MTTGTLYIVATPIGNLDDITFRAVETLKQADLVLSEDTRETDKVLRKYGIEVPQISYRDQNHTRVSGEILEILESGKKVALVTDSGTPLISDPGFKLVKEAAEAGIVIESIPGPSSPISALVASGLPTDKFIFLGFMPKSKAQRLKMLALYGALDCTLTILESPYRIIKLLAEIKEALGNRTVCLVNDQTKKFEKVIRGEPDPIASMLPQKLKGEFIVLVAKEGYKFNF